MPEVSRVMLRQELMATLSEIGMQMEVYRRGAEQLKDVSVYELKDTNGIPVMVPLLAARAQILHSLVLLNQRAQT